MSKSKRAVAVAGAMALAVSTVVTVATGGPAAAGHNARTTTTMKPIIWVANSSEGTISLLDTTTGKERGRYRTGPDSWGSPSRTTVDRKGDVWVANRNSGTAVKYQHPDNCTDRNGNGRVDTSSGSEPLPFGADECYVTTVQVGSGARGIAVDRNNDVWIGSYSAWPNMLRKFRGTDGTQLEELQLPHGAYGALIAPSGHLWVASNQGLLTKVVIDASSPDYRTMKSFSVPRSYGIAADLRGHLWVTTLSNTVHKVRESDGELLGTFVHGQPSSQGVVADRNGDVWIAGGLGGSNAVARMDNDGRLVATITVGSNPTGVAVDAAGKVWSTNLSSNDASRIDPSTNKVDGTFAVGAGPYNYSDMTGFVAHTITDGCRESGIVSRPVHDTVQPPVAERSKEVGALVTEVNCTVIVPAEAALPSGAPAVPGASGVPSNPVLGPSFSDGFEGGQGGWTTTSGKADVWQVGAPTSGPGKASEGTKVAATGLEGNYPDNARDALQSPLIDLTWFRPHDTSPPSTTKGKRAFLSFASAYSSNWYYDCGLVQVSNDRGRSWTTVTPQGGYPSYGYCDGLWTPAFSGRTDDGGWRARRVDLTPYHGQQVQVRFLFTSDGWGNDSGWYVDDVRLELTD